MSQLSPIAVARNWNTKIEVAGLALCALGDIIQAADFERLKCECTPNGIGYILEIIGGSILESSDYVGAQLCKAENPPPA